MRRAIDAGRTPWLCLLFFVPIANYVTMALLAAIPSRARVALRWTEPGAVVDERLRSALLGVAAGVGIAVGMATFSAFVTRTYGLSLFLGTPFVVGVTSGFIHNRGHHARCARPGRSRP